VRLILSILLISLGIALWYWGSLKLVGRRSFLAKIHTLGVSDTLGALFILLGMLVQSLQDWPHMLLAIGAVVFWGTALGMVLARLGNRSKGDEQ
jgi:multicomponent Na+:H+ antiporter subunit G